MAFTRASCGVYDLNGAKYVAIDCGGGGNCLFLSIAWLFRRYNIDANASYTTLRQTASQRLDHWKQNPMAQDHPDPLHTAMPLDRAAAQKLGVAGVWGEFCCIAAIVELYFANGIDVEVQVLSLNALECKSYRSILKVNPKPQHTIHLLYSGRVHYQALILQGTEGNVPPRQVVANYAVKTLKKVLPNYRKRKRIRSDPKPVEKSDPKPVEKRPKLHLTKSVELSEEHVIEVKLDKIDSSSMPDGTLEIHQIDVGQGDAALILIKDDRGDIVWSILVDAGKTGKETAAYFDKLIKKNNFRRIDMFFASHYDGDHIGGAPLILEDDNYTAEHVILYDVGEPQSPDTDYTNYAACKKISQRRLPDLHRPLVDLHGITVTCLAYEGLTPLFKEELVDMDFEEDEEDEEDEKDESYGGPLEDGEGVESVKDGGEKGDGEKEGTIDEEILPDSQEFFYFNSSEHKPLSQKDILKAQYAHEREKNDTSIALLVQYKDFYYFTSGDRQGSAEIYAAREAGKYIHDHVCVLKAGHHGAVEATKPKTLEILKPRVILFSCGEGNGFGHPSESTIKRIADLSLNLPCRWLSTGKILTDNEQDSTNAETYYFGQPDKNGSHEEGDIVITVDSSICQGDKHGFLLKSKSNKNTLFTCGERSGRVEVVNVEKKNRRTKAYLANQGNREERRKEKAEDKRKTARDWLKKQFLRHGVKLEDLEKGPDFPAELKEVMSKLCGTQLGTVPSEWEQNLTVQSFIKGWAGKHKP